jgi:pimeloyl-ACP methyl ester carboxylesterase
LQHPELQSEIVRLSSSTGHEPIFCIHPAGGLAWCYYGLATSLSSRYSLYGVQSPGNTNKATSYEGVRDAYLSYAKQIQPEGPYNLLGWSSGGYIAYKIACKLGGYNVRNLIMLDSYPRSYYNRLTESEAEDAYGRLADEVCNFTSGVLSKAEVIEGLRRFDSIEEEVPNETFTGNVIFVRAAGHERDPRVSWSMRLTGPVHIMQSSFGHDDLLNPVSTQEISKFIQGLIV